MRSFLIALIALGPLAAYAGPAEDTVKARRAYFKLVGANMGPLAGMAKGEIDYDAAAAETHAKNLALLSSYDARHLLMPGTSNEDVPGETRALPKIWTDFDGFKGKYGDFVKAVDALQSQAGAGREALGPALGQLGGTCKGCHDNYRAKDF